MLSLLLALTPAAQSDYHKSLAWADRLYAKAAARPFTLCVYEYEDLLNPYAELIRKYGPRREAQLGIARCVALEGRLERAAALYRKLPKGACPDAERRDAIDAGEIVRRLKGKATGHREIIQAARVPLSGGHVWAVLWSRRHWPEDEHDIQSDSLPQGRLYKETGRFGSVTPVGKLHDWPAGGEEFRIAHLITTTLGRRRMPAVIVDLFSEVGHSDNHTLFVYAAKKRGLLRVGKFETVEHPLVHRGREGQLLLSLSKTWKVYWPDQIEWLHGRFRLANRLYPEFYREEAKRVTEWYVDQQDDYEGPLFSAALDMVFGKPDRALRHLTSAERLCRKSLYYESHPSERPTEYGFHRYSFNGSTRENLREIRQRIRWIRQGELNHALLYRPYDFDLQIPPYELGNSIEDES